MDDPQALQQLLPTDYELGIPEPVRNSNLREGREEWKSKGPKGNKRDSLWTKWLYWPPAQGVQRVDEDIWTWPIAERKRKADECVSGFACCVAVSCMGLPQVRKHAQLSPRQIHAFNINNVQVVQGGKA